MSLLHFPYCHHPLTASQARQPTGPGNPADPSRFAAIGKTIADEFMKSTGGTLRGYRDVWGPMLAGHVALFEHILNADHHNVSALIADLHRNGLGTGMRWPADWSEMILGQGTTELFRTCLLDKTISLCEVLGLQQAYNPEDGLPPPRYDGVELLGRIDQHLGYEASSPSCFSLAYGALRPSGATIDDRSLHAIYTSERILTLLGTLGVPPDQAHVLEIGGGIGNLAYHMLKRGVGRYSLVDIPTVRAIQTYMTLYEFPGIAVNFDSVGVREPARIDLVTSDALTHLPDRSVHIVVNEDSLPEILSDVAAEYVRQIGRVTSGFFLSINHDSRREISGHVQTPVARLAADVPALRPFGRWRHWLRAGYLEEIFEPRPADRGCGNLDY